jgi:glycogen operon protein
VDDNFLLLINAHHEEIPFVLPGFHSNVRWQIAIDTSQGSAGPDMRRYHARGDVFPLQGRSLVLLLQPQGRAEAPPAGTETVTEPAGGLQFDQGVRKKRTV